MNYVFVVIIACILSYFIPQYKFQLFNSFFSRLFNFLFSSFSITKSESKKSWAISYILCGVLCIFSFILPTVLFFYISTFSNIIMFIIEILVAYQLISIPRVQSLFGRVFLDDITENATTIIHTIIVFIDNFFIPCFCISLFGLPFALLYKAFSFCTKVTLIEQNSNFELIEKVHSFLYFIPSYFIVLTIHVASMFFPFSNTRNAYSAFATQRKKIKPYWLSRILATCCGSVCIEIPVSFYLNGTIVTENIGNTGARINQNDVKSIFYLLYCSGLVVLFVTSFCRLVLTWGVW